MPCITQHNIHKDESLPEQVDLHIPQLIDESVVYGSQSFLDRLEETDPQSRSYKDTYTAKENLPSLYLEAAKDGDYLTFDDGLLKLLGCFE